MNEQKNPDMLVDIVDCRGIPMEAPIPLADAQTSRRGYRSFHVWVLRETDGGRIEALLRHSLSDGNSGGSSFDVAVRVLSRLAKAGFYQHCARWSPISASLLQQTTSVSQGSYHTTTI